MPLKALCSTNTTHTRDTQSINLIQGSGLTQIKRSIWVKGRGSSILLPRISVRIFGATLQIPSRIQSWAAPTILLVQGYRELVCYNKIWDMSPKKATLCINGMAAFGIFIFMISGHGMSNLCYREARDFLFSRITRPIGRLIKSLDIENPLW